MATVYWYGDGGNWSDHTNHWSNTSGGAGGADPHGSAPGTDDDVVFDANSFTAGGQTVTVDAAANCKDMTWTGATNSPTLTVSNALNFYGDVTLIGTLTTGGNSYIAYKGTGTESWTSNGCSLACQFIASSSATGTLTLQDAFVSTKNAATGFYWSAATLNTNNQTMTVIGFDMAGATAKTLTLGSSTVNTGLWNMSGSNITLTANTSTINCSGNFSGGGLTTYNRVNLTEATSTITGSNTIQQFGLTRAGVQTITFTDGTTTTVTNMTRSAGTDVKTLVGSSTAGWNIAKAGGGTIGLDYLALSYSNATAGKFYAGANSTNTVGNTGWTFTEKPTFKIAPASSAKIGIAPASSAKIAMV